MELSKFIAFTDLSQIEDTCKDLRDMLEGWQNCKHRAMKFLRCNMSNFTVIYNVGPMETCLCLFSVALPIPEILH